MSPLGPAVNTDAQNSPSAPPLADPIFLDRLRDQMLAFANLQLNDIHLAEDCVQEALLSALKNVGSFKGEAAFKTWVFAILRNKIIDHFRKKKRSPEIDNAFDENDGGDLSEQFDHRGHWRAEQAPNAWSGPMEGVVSEQFWQVFEACLENLSAKHARVFMMREFVGLNTQEICEALEVSITNLNVMLYRARLGLQTCLDIKWFASNRVAS